MNNLLLSSTLTPTPDRESSVGALCRELVTAFRASGIPMPELDARILVCHALGITHEDFVASPEARTSALERQLARGYAERRCAREPVSRIVGMREFRGLEFEITPETLDPRPDTETVVDASLEVVGSIPCSNRPRILDIGAGSGCVLISLLHEVGKASGVGTDVSEGALCVARRNATRHGVAARSDFVCTSWTDGLAESFDLVVSNPPYIATGAIGDLEPDVRVYDPKSALDGGDDGLDGYRAVVPALARNLLPGGWVVFETGAGQAEAVAEMLIKCTGAPEFDELRHWRDLAGLVRCVGARRSPSL